MWGINADPVSRARQCQASEMTEFQFNDAALANLKDKVVIVTGSCCVELRLTRVQVVRAELGKALSNTLPDTAPKLLAPMSILPPIPFPKG